MDKVLEKILQEVADEENVSIEEVRKIFELPYKLMRSTISKLELEGKMANEVAEMKTNFNMPALFKLFLNTKKLENFNKKKNGQIL